MALDERSRQELAQRLEAGLGPRTAELLMDSLPPAAWSDLATKKDLEVLEHQLLAEIHKVARVQTLAFVTVMAVMNGITFTALKLG